MATKLASAKITRDDAGKLAFSRNNLFITRKLPDGPLMRLIEWVKSVEGSEFDQACIKLGDAETSYAFLYYHSGMRYMVDKHGKAHVTSADADMLHTELLRDLQATVDLILADELTRYMRAVTKRNGIPSSKSKQYVDPKTGVNKPRIMTGFSA